MRVKKVRGEENIGITGVVLSLEPDICDAILGYDFVVRMDVAAVGSRWGKTICPPGTTGVSRANQWEPILLADDKACEEDFKQSLDRLLEREGATC